MTKKIMDRKLAHTKTYIKRPSPPQHQPGKFHAQRRVDPTLIARVRGHIPNVKGEDLVVGYRLNLCNISFSSKPFKKTRKKNQKYRHQKKRNRNKNNKQTTKQNKQQE